MVYLEFNLTIDDFIFDILFIHNLFIPFMLRNRSLIFFVTLTSFIKKSNKKSDQPLIFQAFSHACSPTYKLQLTKKKFSNL